MCNKLVSVSKDTKYPLDQRKRILKKFYQKRIYQSWVSNDIEHFRKLLIDVTDISNKYSDHDLINNVLHSLNNKYDTMINQERSILHQTDRK